MPEQDTATVRGGLVEDEVTVQQPDIDYVVAAAVADAEEKLRVAGRRPLNAGAQTVAFGEKKAVRGSAERNGVRATVSITVSE